MGKKHFLKVILDQNATILDFECNLLDEQNPPLKDDVIGQNWFDKFISPSDLDNVKRVFSDVFNNESKTNWKTNRNDVKINEKHYLINFDNSIEVINGQKVVISIGEDYYLMK